MKKNLTLLFKPNRKLSSFFLLFVFIVIITSKVLSQNVDCGFNHSVAVKADGSVVCWGSSGTPSPNSGFVAVSAGWGHSIGLKSDGSIVCWGNNGSGECNVPAPNLGFVAISAGIGHSMGLKSDGSVVCWGDNGNGQCNAPTPNSGFVAISAGSQFSAGLKSDGSIVCWGRSDLGQCNVPSPNSSFIGMAAGELFTVGLKSDGSVVCWGFTCNPSPSPNTGFVTVNRIYHFAAGLKSDGSVVCWGSNGNGQCNVPTPNSGFIAASAGGEFTIGLKSDGSLVGWGSNSYGQINLPSPNSGYSTLPTAPVPLAASAITASSFTANWIPSYNATGYRLDISTHADFSTCDILNNQAISGASTISYNVSGITRGVYYYRIRAVNASGTSSNSVTIIADLRLDQNITFNALPSKTYGDASFTVTATGGVTGNPVTFTSSDNTVATSTGINGATIIIMKAGSCNIIANQAGNATYKPAQASQTLTVNKKTLTVSSITPQTKVYDGNTTLTITGGTLNGVINSDDVTFSGTLNFADKNVGTGKALSGSGLTLSGTKAGNYKLTQPTGFTANITKASLTISLAAQNKVYDGTTNASVTTSFTAGLISGDAVTASTSNSKFDNKNVGSSKTVTADVTLNGTDAGNYSYSSALSTSAGIAPKILTAFIAAQNKVYDGNTSASVTTSFMGLITGDAVTANASNVNFNNKNVGNGKTVTANISISGTDAGNYDCNTTASTIANITKKDMAIGITAQNKAYDGNTNASVAASITSGLVSGDIVTANASSSAFDNKNAGNGKTVTANISISGTDAGNYSCNATATSTANITKKALTIAITAQNKVYDGNTNASVTTAINGLVTGDAVTASASNTNFSDKNAGNGKTVTANISISGTDAGNYACNTTANTTANITKAMLVIGLTAQNKIYDGNTNALVTAAITSGLVTGEVVTASAANGIFDNKNAGNNKTVTANISISGADAGNYICNATATSTANITRKALTIGITAQNKAYDGNANASVTTAISGLVTGDAVAANASNCSFNNKSLGNSKPVTADISISGTDAGNYTCNATANTTADITKATLVIGLTAQNKIYDGNTNASVTAAIVSGLVTGETVTASTSNAKFDTRNAGDGKAVTADISISGTDAGNYISSSTAGTIANITKKALTINISAQDKVYDGTVNAVISAAINNSLITGDVVTANVSNGVFDNKNAGNGKPVTADISLTGADAGNYTCNSTASSTANITKAALVIGITPQNKTYDGTDKATVTAITSGLITGDAVNVNVSNGRFNDKNIGNDKAVTADVSINGTDAGNYTCNSLANSTANISKAALGVELTAQNKTYDGTANATVNAATVSGLITGEIVTVNAGNGKFDNKNAGDNKTVTADISISGIDAGNYTCNTTANTTATISKANLTAEITVTPNTDSYKGGSAVTFSVTYPAAIDTTEGDPMISLTGTGINTNVAMTTTDRITWTYQWTVPATGNDTVTIGAILPDVAGNFVQSVTGKTSIVIENSPNGISRVTKNNNQVIVYPTLNQGRFNINMNTPENGKVNVKIMNISGTSVDECEFNKTSQHTTFEIVMTDAKQGQYVVVISMTDYRDIQKIVVE